MTNESIHSIEPENIEAVSSNRDSLGRFSEGNQFHGSRRGIANKMHARLAEKISASAESDPLCVLHEMMIDRNEPSSIRVKAAEALLRVLLPKLISIASDDDSETVVQFEAQAERIRASIRSLRDNPHAIR